jgi:large subunit ribosomal protein L35
MPKMKTHRGAAKRFKVTGSGKILRKQAGVRHLLEHKSGTRRRRQQQEGVVHEADRKRVKRLLGR